MSSAKVHGGSVPTVLRAPERVMHALDSLYPRFTNVQWSRKRKKYTADFIYNGLNVSVTFNEIGHVLNILEEIPFDSVPIRIKDKINLFYNSYKIVMVLQRTTRERLEYDIQVIKGKQHYILNYHAKGYLIHQYEVSKIDYSTQFGN